MSFRITNCISYRCLHCFFKVCRFEFSISLPPLRMRENMLYQGIIVVYCHIYVHSEPPQHQSHYPVAYGLAIAYHIWNAKPTLLYRCHRLSRRDRTALEENKGAVDHSPSVSHSPGPSPCAWGLLEWAALKVREYHHHLYRSTHQQLHWRECVDWNWPNASSFKGDSPLEEVIVGSEGIDLLRPQGNNEDL